MAAPEFRLFSSLPAELRQEIYLWATPPRFVHVEESLDQEYEDFLEEIRRVPNRINLDASLVSFAFNWRDKVPRRRQSRLESFGFTNNKPEHCSWTPNSSAPEIPIDWLDENPHIAWEVARKSHLHSKAPIPTLLRVCRDSRMSLMQRGYQLAFRTRSSPPRTWFNFSRDFLITEKVLYFDEDRNFLSPGLWDFSQFHPGDMQMVRNLAVWGSHNLFRSNLSLVDLGHLSPVFRLFPRLNELLFAEWTDSDLQEWPRYPKSTDHVKQDTPARDLWVCIPVEDIDSSFSLFFREQFYFRNSLGSTGQSGWRLIEHKRENGPDAPFQEDTGHIMEQIVAEHMNSLYCSESGIPVGSWKAPKFTLSHVLSSTAYEFLKAERLKIAEILCHLQEEWISIRRSRDSTAIQSSQEKKAEEEFINSYWPDVEPHDCVTCSTWCYYQKQDSSLRKWWIEESLPIYSGYPGCQDSH